MPGVKINKEEFQKWAAESEIMYASESSIPHPRRKGVTRCLRFMCKLGGGYRVVLGSANVLYDGDGFDLAVEAYNTAGESDGSNTG